MQDLHRTDPTPETCAIDRADDTGPARQHDLDRIRSGTDLPLEGLEHEVAFDDTSELWKSCRKPMAILWR